MESFNSTPTSPSMDFSFHLDAFFFSSCELDLKHNKKYHNRRCNIVQIHLWIVHLHICIQVFTYRTRIAPSESVCLKSGFISYRALHAHNVMYFLFNIIHFFLDFLVSMDFFFFGCFKLTLFFVFISLWFQCAYGFDCCVVCWSLFFIVIGLLLLHYLCFFSFLIKYFETANTIWTLVFVSTSWTIFNWIEMDVCRFARLVKAKWHGMRQKNAGIHFFRRYLKMEERVLCLMNIWHKKYWGFYLISGSIHHQK